MPSGQVVFLNTLVGIAVNDIPNQTVGPVRIEGIVEVPKAVGEIWSQGYAVGWDVSESVFSFGYTPAAGDINNAAKTAAAAGSADTVGLVYLTPQAAVPQ